MLKILAVLQDKIIIPNKQIVEYALQEVALDKAMKSGLEHALQFAWIYSEYCFPLIGSPE